MTLAISSELAWQLRSPSLFILRGYQLPPPRIDRTPFTAYAHLLEMRPEIINKNIIAGIFAGISKVIIKGIIKAIIKDFFTGIFTGIIKSIFKVIFKGINQVSPCDFTHQLHAIVPRDDCWFEP